MPHLLARAECGGRTLQDRMALVVGRNRRRAKQFYTGQAIIQLVKTGNYKPAQTVAVNIICTCRRRLNGAATYLRVKDPLKQAIPQAR